MNMQEMRDRAKEIKQALHKIGVPEKIFVAARSQAYGIERCHFMCKKLDDAVDYNGGAVAGEYNQTLAYEHLAKRHLFQLEKMLEEASPAMLERARRVCHVVHKNWMNADEHSDGHHLCRMCTVANKLLDVAKICYESGNKARAEDIVKVMESLR